MKEIILNSIKEFSDNAQINLQAESAQLTLATKIAQDLEPHIREQMGKLVEDVVCGGSYHGDE